MLDATAYAGPIAVTLAYLGLYYAFQVNILKVKTTLARQYQARGEKFDRYFGQDRELLAADRLQLNTLEHMPPFLVLLWLDAVFVDVSGATIAGAIYVAMRAVYPFLVGRRLGRNIQARVMASTFVGYAVLAYFMVMIVLELV